MSKKILGKKWRFSAYDKDYNRLNIDEKSNKQHFTFDELVIDDWFHIEQMDDQFYWMRIGDVSLELKLIDGKYVLKRQDSGEVIK